MGGGGSGAKVRSMLICGCEVSEDVGDDTLKRIKGQVVNIIDPSSAQHFPFEWERYVTIHMNASDTSLCQNYDQYR